MSGHPIKVMNNTLTTDSNQQLDLRIDRDRGGGDVIIPKKFLHSINC